MSMKIRHSLTFDLSMTCSKEQMDVLYPNNLA